MMMLEPTTAGVALMIDLEEVYCDERTAFQRVTIADTPGYGRALFMDGLIQSTSSDEALYHEALIHPAAVLHGGPRRVLVAGAGEGASLRELLRHPTVEKIVAVDLDGRAIELAKRYLPQWHDGAFDDPRVELRIEDIRETLASSEAGEFDLVVLDVTDPVEEGPSVELFVREFFVDVKRVLAEDGMVVMQSGELDPVDARVVSVVRATMADVFSDVATFQVPVPSFHCIWSFTLAANRTIDVEPADLASRVERLDGSKLRCYEPAWHRSLFAIPKYLRELIETSGRVVRASDDTHLVAYNTAEHPDEV